MKRIFAAFAVLLIAISSAADDISGSNRYLCASLKVVVCFEDGECATFQPWEVDVPQFVIVDTKKKRVSTTKASGENRSTPIRAINREDSKIFLQGVEGGRAFSFVIDEETGLLTAAVSRDGLTVSVFGACTDTDL